VAVLFPFLFALVPSACWAFIARTVRVGVAIGIPLVCGAGLVAAEALEWTYTRAETELYVAFAPVSALLVLAGSMVERRLLGPRKQVFWGAPQGAGLFLFAYLLAMVLVITPLYFLIVLSSESIPRAETVPMPDGLTAQATDGYCGTNYCERTLTVGDSSGLPGAEISRRVRERLAADGWRPGRDGELVRRYGRLLDDRQVGVYLTEHATSVEISLGINANA